MEVQSGPSQRPTPQAESLGKASGGPSRPSYHPKDLDEDGVVSEEDLKNWEKLSEAEKRARLTGSVRGGGSLTSKSWLSQRSLEVQKPDAIVVAEKPMESVTCPKKCVHVVVVRSS